MVYGIKVTMLISIHFMIEKTKPELNSARIDV